jgi:predicted DCC family thiol-disulfide oxidoreductase YuxK
MKSAMRSRVWFDGGCHFCRGQVRWLERLDWFHRFEFRPAAELTPTQDPRLAPENLARAVHCVTVDDRVFRGARCLRFVGLRLPLLAPVAVLLYLPGVIQLAEAVYGRVSRHRYRLGGQRECALESTTPKKPGPDTG